MRPPTETNSQDQIYFLVNKKPLLVTQMLPLANIGRGDKISNNLRVSSPVLLAPPQEEILDVFCHDLDLGLALHPGQR